MPLIYFLPPLATVLIWSGNMTINQLTVGAIAPSSIAFLRWLLALVVMEHVLQHRAQCGDVTPPAPPIPAHAGR